MDEENKVPSKNGAVEAGEFIEKARKSGKFLMMLTYIDQDDIHQHHLVRQKYPIEDMRRAIKEAEKMVEVEIKKVIEGGK